MRINRHLGGLIVAVVVALGLWTVPANATVHEIVAQWCSGQDELAPPGISDSQKRNFAQPLNAAKIVMISGTKWPRPSSSRSTTITRP